MERLSFITNKLHCSVKVGVGMGMVGGVVRGGLSFIPNKLYCFVKVGVGMVVMKKSLLHPYFVKAARRSGWGWEYRRKWEERDRVGIGKGRLGGDGFQEKGD